MHLTRNRNGLPQVLNPLPGPFRHEAGPCWSTILDAEAAARCEAARKIRPQDCLNIGLWEEGRPLGIYSFDHARARLYGHGMFYLTWQPTPTLFFSTRGNTDPRAMQRSLALSVSSDVPEMAAVATHDIPVRELEQILVQSAHRFVERTASADKFYLSRINRGLLLGPYDHEIASYVLHTFKPSTTAVIEIGAGMGHLPLLLAMRGFAGISIDADPGRIRGAAALYQDCWLTDPSIADRYWVMYGKFPQNGMPLVPHRQNVAIFTNLGIGLSDDFCDAAIEACDGADFVIVDMVRFFRHRDRPDQEQLQRKIESRYKTRGQEIALSSHYNLMIFKLR